MYLLRNFQQWKMNCCKLTHLFRAFFHIRTQGLFSHLGSNINYKLLAVGFFSFKYVKIICCCCPFLVLQRVSPCRSRAISWRTSCLSSSAAKKPRNSSQAIKTRPPISYLHLHARKTKNVPINVTLKHMVRKTAECGTG